MLERLAFLQHDLRVLLRKHHPRNANSHWLWIYVDWKKAHSFVIINWCKISRLDLGFSCTNVLQRNINGISLEPCTYKSLRWRQACFCWREQTPCICRQRSEHWNVKHTPLCKHSVAVGCDLFSTKNKDETERHHGVFQDFEVKWSELPHLVFKVLRNVFRFI